MINITVADGTAERELLNSLRQRSGETDKKVTAAVTDILENVKARIGKIVNKQEQRQKWFSDAAYEELLVALLREQYIEKDMDADSVDAEDNVTMQSLLKAVELILLMK